MSIAKLVLSSRVDNEKNIYINCFVKMLSVVNMTFKEKVILITGAGAGIGAQTAKHFAKLGGRLAIVDCNFDRLNAVAKEIIQSGASIPLVIVADVTDDPAHIISETIEHFGQLDILVNNVGIVARQSLSNLEMSSFDRIMNINVRSVVALTRLAIPHLEFTKGNIVNVSSVVGILPHPEMLAYSMSKAAICQFTKCIAVELGPKGIRVNAVCPGITNTAMIESIPNGEKEEMLTFFRSTYPLQRIGEPTDISRVIAFLASPEASFVTGGLYNVDGGAIAANIV